MAQRFAQAIGHRCLGPIRNHFDRIDQLLALRTELTELGLLGELIDADVSGGGLALVFERLKLALQRLNLFLQVGFFLQERLDFVRLNGVIDCALLRPDQERGRALPQCHDLHEARRLAERVRRRATILCRRERARCAAILTARDTLILTLYAATTPPQWYNAWCDGSSRPTQTGHRAGIGGVVMNAHGELLERIARGMGEETAFNAEIHAAAAVLVRKSVQKESLM